MTNEPIKDLIDNLLHEVMSHPHHEELLSLIQAQCEDDNMVALPEVLG